VVVGSGPERDHLLHLVEELGMRGRVHFLRFRDDVPEILAASELLVLPSRGEGMPNAVLEAMASGKPVVATRVEGVEELLGPATDDQSVLQSDSEAFTAKVIAILSDPALAARLGTENRLRAQSRFSQESMTIAYERLYRELVAANR
jgi:glycosyltransferase involved in cell wall biosynthesis